MSTNIYTAAVFCYFIFIFHTQHNIISKIQQNKTADTYSHLKVQSKGRERGKDNKNTKVTPLYNHVSTKTLPSINGEGLAPPTRAVVHSHDTICRRLRIQYVSTHVWCKPVLNYCLLHSCKTSKQHSLLH